MHTAETNLLVLLSRITQTALALLKGQALFAWPKYCTLAPTSSTHRSSTAGKLCPPSSNSAVAVAQKSGLHMQLANHAALLGLSASLTRPQQALVGPSLTHLVARINTKQCQRITCTQHALSIRGACMHQPHLARINPTNSAWHDGSGLNTGGTSDSSAMGGNL